MNRLFAFAILIVLTNPLLAGCRGVPARFTNHTPDSPSGFRRLFDWRTLDGWQGWIGDPSKPAPTDPAELAIARVNADQRMHDHWYVHDGVLVFDGAGDNLCTASSFTNFELLLEWKISPNGDSGIYLRGCPQVQIWDDPTGSGGLYNNKQNVSQPLVRADRAPGEWNHFRIRMVGNRVTVHLNGVLVVDDVVMENMWDRSASIPQSGPIELQAHGTPLWFRNVWIRRLNEPRE